MLTHTPTTATSGPPAAKKPTRKGQGWLLFVTVLLSLSVLLTIGYTAISIYMAYATTQLSLTHRMPVDTTPASLGLQYKDVTFPSRYDHVQLKGWFIPGILSNSHLTAQRAIIMVHGDVSNRVDKGVGILNLSGDLAHQGFAVLTFDMRGNGDSPAAPRSLGQYEQRDVMGAVDFLQSGSLPYPELGHPRAIVGWGESMGGATLILATANEPAIRAIVSDSAYADVLPRIERDVPAQGHTPAWLTPGGMIAARVLYGVDYFNIRPVDVIASITPRPILLIQGTEDNKNHRDTPPSHMFILAAAALSSPNANIQTWFVPGATHAQAYHVLGKVYVDRLVAFYTAAVGPDTGES